MLLAKILCAPANDHCLPPCEKSNLESLDFDFDLSLQSCSLSIALTACENKVEQFVFSFILGSAESDLH